MMELAVRDQPAHVTSLVEEAWEVCGDLFTTAVAEGSDPSDAVFLEELTFCLLGGHAVSYELGLSATQKVLELEPFGYSRSHEELESTLAGLLSSPSFEPRRANGCLRRYRFPNAGARAIVRARDWVHQNGSPPETLQAISDESERRRFLCDCPGIGPKKASWILRNLGMASSLAIVDVHVLQALTRAGKVRKAQLPRDYECVESVFLEWCEELNAPPAAFDLFLWEWQRGSLAI